MSRDERKKERKGGRAEGKREVENWGGLERSNVEV
jgi:hypothetical protein